jgi:hypothetical protein
MKDPGNSRTKTCPACGTDFSCCTNNCWCAELPQIIPLTDKGDCYCPECLKKKISEKMGKNEYKLEKGDHYINEQGNWVFTAQYHLKRGYCCQNGCKHCPYGFKKKII